MIPELSKVYGWLPSGIHDATWAEVVAQYCTNTTRRRLLEGLKMACLSLKSAGATHVYLDGSFVTAKKNPGDWDACYGSVGVDISKLDPALRDFSNNRAAQKTKFFGEMFPAEVAADLLGQPYLDFFQTDKTTRRKKGIIRLDLGTIT
jgi:hypothetical protein